MESKYVADFVRELVDDDARCREMMARLEQGLAYIEDAFLVTVVIDISGYSRITSKLTKLGKVSSEIITRTVGRYLNQIIDVVSSYNGDIVKFLGDAILVTFGAKEETEAWKKATFSRAVLCCVTVLTECSEYEIPMDELKTVDSVPISRLSQVSENENYKLYLHIAVTAGQTQRVVMGNPLERLDYSISGSHLSALGSILNATTAADLGELGLDTRSWSQLFPNDSCPPNIQVSIQYDSNSFVKCGPMACSILRSHFLQTNSNQGDELSPWKVKEPVSRQSRLAKFINQSILKKLMAINEPRPGKQPRVTGDQTMQKESAFSLPETSTGDFNSDSSESNASPHVFRGLLPERDFRKRSAVYDDGIAGEFRTVTVAFVKLKFEFHERTSQLAVFGFLNVLKNYEGYFQQFSIDDKGQTLLGVFGLPPLSHVSEPEQAVKAMAEFADFAKEHLASKVTIGLSTGDILFTSLGTKRRREASLLGDVVNIAARLMSFQEFDGGAIVDDATHFGSSQLYVHTDIGEHKIKGKKGAIHLWRIIKEQQPIDLQADEFCGYDNERDIIVGRYKEWKNLDKESVILIEGASGLGKSKLGSFVTTIAKADKIPVCLVQGKDILAFLWPYFGLSRVVSFMFNFFQQSQNSGYEQNVHLQRNHSSALKSSALTFLPTPTMSQRTTTVHKFKSSQDDVMPTNAFNGHNFRGDNSQLVDFIKYHQQDPHLAPLLQGLLPAYMSIPETDATKALDPQARSNLQRSMVLRIFSSFVSKHNSIFIFDDSQWLDEQSLEGIMTIVKLSVQAFVLILSRPIGDFTSQALQSLSTHPHVKQLTLSGLSKDAVQEIIDMIGKEVYIDQAGCLKLSNIVRDVDQILLASVGAGITLQFDRLPQQFQEILRIASCLGQYFNLEDVIEIGGIHMPVAEMYAYIEQNDRYNFLELAGYSPHDYDTHDCSFRHISILNAIYESLPYSERISVNLTAARRLERVLTLENEDIVLPAMSFHYSRTMEFERNICCLERLGYKYVDRCAFAEGAQTLTKLETFFQTLEPRDAATINTLRRAHWLAETAWANSQLKYTQKAVADAICCLDLMTNGTWPKGERELKRKFKTCMARLWTLWILTNGGKRALTSASTRHLKRSIHPSGILAIQNELNVATISARCFSSITFAAFYDQKILPLLIGVSALELLCYVITRAQEDISQWRIVLARCSIIFLFSVKPLAKIFHKRLNATEELSPKTYGHYLQLGILSMMVEAKQYKTAEYLSNYVR
ncbi:hypothetical protein HDU76_003283 [Blyttiomyces sp. JEL0837]|nr:hypothetical protein HDU76_003283 [Blyttiomyces sp. JEL0837]